MVVKKAPFAFKIKLKPAILLVFSFPHKAKCSIISSFIIKYSGCSATLFVMLGNSTREQLSKITMHKGDHVLLTNFTYVPLIKLSLYFQACKEKLQLPVAHLTLVTLVKKGGVICVSGANFSPLFFSTRYWNWYEKFSLSPKEWNTWYSFHLRFSTRHKNEDNLLFLLRVVTFWGWEFFSFLLWIPLGQVGTLGSTSGFRIQNHQR